MKKFTIEVSNASGPQLQTIGLELKIMANNWERFGPRIYINSKKLQAPSLTEPRHKRQASSSKPQDPRIRAQAWAAKRQAASFKLDKRQAIRYYRRYAR